MNARVPSHPITREETIFNAAVELRDPAKRATYLELACEGDPALRARLEKMLAADGDSFFEKPIPAPSLADAVTLAASASPVADPVATSEHIGRYKLLQKIGEGGCGAVYMAEQSEPVRRRVALKVIKLGMNTNSEVKFPGSTGDPPVPRGDSPRGTEPSPSRSATAIRRTKSGE